MAKVKATLIKGPQFDQVEKKAYGLLHDILLKKTKEPGSAQNDISKVAND